MKLTVLDTILNYLGLSQVEQHVPPSKPLSPRLATALDTLRQERLHWLQQGLSYKDIKAAIEDGRQ